jgi:single-strand DNA-binding protein
VRYTPNGKPVANLALAYNHGLPGEDGNKPTQWVDAAFWGERAEKLSPYLLKGTLVHITAKDAHIETYQGKNGPGSKLVCNIIELELVQKPASAEGQAPAPRPAPRPAPQAAPHAAHAAAAQTGTGFDGMDSDIPF